MKVISGCQTGADEAGLIVAERLGLSTGGTMPRGYRTQQGPRPDLAQKYGLDESRSEKYPPRTRKNVKDADVTLLFGNMDSPGCSLTIKYCNELGRPYYAVPMHELEVDMLGDFVFQFLMEHKPKVINIAGNREESNPGISKFTIAVLEKALPLYKGYRDSIINVIFNGDVE